MNVPKPLRIVGYVVWFFSCLVFAFYATFPIEMIKGQLEAAMESGLGKGKQGRYGVDPDVQIGKLSMWRLSGVQAKLVSVQFASRDPDPGPTVFLDEVSMRVGIFSYLFSDPTISFAASAYGGDISGSATVDLEPGTGKAKGKVPPQLRALEVDVDDIDVSRIPALHEKVGAPLTGKIVGTVALDLGEKPEKEAEGEVDLAIKGMTLGPGEVAKGLPGLSGGLTIPLVQMGDLVVKAKAAKGKLQSERVGIAGKDFTAEIDARVNLNRRIGVSGLRGDGWFQISDEFLDANSKFKTIFEITPALKKAKQDDGKYGFRLAGTLSNPKPSVGKSRARPRR